jgi:hypothetical protein
MVTENVYQAMFLVYDRGVVVVDAPPSIPPDTQGHRRSHRQADHAPDLLLLHSDHIGGARPGLA